MKKFSAVICVIFALACNKKEEVKAAYPDCFEDQIATHAVLASCGSSTVYVTMSETSVVLFALKDEGLGIGEACKDLTVADLIDWSAVQFLEWNTHPDSLAPNFCDDIAYMNMSTIRRWDLTSGDITAAVSKPAEEREFMESYRVSISLKDAIFDRSADGLENVTIDKMVIKEAHVGWFPG